MDATRFVSISILVFMMAFGAFAPAFAGDDNKDNKDQPETRKAITNVRLQLQWKHQFEFAGFYAAKERGFYADAGLDVEIREIDGDTGVIQSVVEGEADFGVWYADLIRAAMDGAPVVMLSNYFKRSPLVLITRADIYLPTDLRGKTIMTTADQINSANFMRMFRSFGLGPGDYRTVPHTFSIDPFVNGEVDAFMAFYTNEPFQLRSRNIPFNVLDPNNYGVEFYDVNLFTSERLLRERPKVVEAFKKASDKGWEYALKHSEEIIDTILERYNSQDKGRRPLEYEAQMTKMIMLPSIFPVGAIDPARIKKIESIFLENGIGEKHLDIERFLFDPLRHARTVRLTTLDWPPFTGSDLPELGMNAGLVRERFEAAGYTVEIEVVPWLEAVMKAKNSQVDGYFPEYYAAGLEHNFIFSEPIGDSYLGLAERKAAPISWQKPEDLIPYRVGTVEGYVNTPWIDRWLGEGRMTGVKALDDMANLHNLMAGKVEIAVIDPLVFHYIAGKSRRIERNLQLNKTLIDRKKLFVCFTKNERGRRLAEDFNRTVSRMDPGRPGYNDADYLKTHADRLNIPPLERLRAMKLWDEKRPEVDFTEAERDFIRRHPRVTVAMLPDFVPLAYAENGVIKGFSKDLLDLISEKSGMIFTPVIDIWSANLEKFRAGQVEMIDAISHKPEREAFTLFTEPYYEVPVTVFVREEFDTYEGIDTLRGRTVGIIADVFYEADLRRTEGITVREYPTGEAAIKALSFGEVDAAIQSFALGNHMIRKNGLTNIQVGGELILPGIGKEDLRFGVRTDLPELHAIVQKAMEAITPQERNALIDRWMGAKVSTFALQGDAKVPTFALQGDERNDGARKLDLSQDGVRKLELSQEEAEFLKTVRKIRVPVIADEPPLTFVENGEAAGFLNEMLDTVAAMLGLSVERVYGMAYNETLRALANNEVDLLNNYGYGRIYDDAFLLTQPVMQTPFVAVARRGTIPVESVDEMMGKTVIGVEGQQQMRIIGERFPAVRRSLVPTIAEGYRALRNNKGDYYIDNLVHAGYYIHSQMMADLKIAGELPEEETGLLDFRFAIRADWPLLRSAVQKALDAHARQTTHEERHNMRLKWLIPFQEDAPEPIRLTPAERAFVKAAPVIRVSNETDWPPMDFAIEGEPRGFSIDFIRLLGKKTGLNFAFVNGYTWDELLAMFRAGELDMIQSVIITPERREYTLFTAPYFHYRNRFVVRDDGPAVESIQDLFGKTVAVPRGWASEEFIRATFPQVNRLLVANIPAGMEAVRDGKADAMVESDPQIRYMREKHLMDGLKATGWFREYDRGTSATLHLGVHRDQPMLHQILNKAIRHVTPGEFRQLEEKWFGGRLSLVSTEDTDDDELPPFRSLIQRPEKRKENPTFALFYDHPSPFWDRATRFARAMANDLGVTLKVIDSQNDPAYMVERIEALCAEGLDGIIAKSLKGNGEAVLELTERCGVPLILINADIPGRNIAPRTRYKTLLAKLIPDDFNAGRAIAERLLAASKKRQFETRHLLVIEGEPGHEASDLRTRGMTAYIENFGELDSFVIRSGGWQAERAADIFAEEYEKNPDINIVWSANETMALAVIDRIRRMGETGIDKPILVGCVNWSERAVREIRDGAMVVCAGGHFIEAAWAVLMLHDYINGEDFSFQGTSFKTPLTPLSTDNMRASVFLTMDPEVIDFRHLSKIYNPTLYSYDFSLNNLARQLASREGESSNFRTPGESSDFRTPTASTVVLTEREKAFMAANPVIRVMNEDDYPPFDFTENGEPKGFSIDYLKLIARKTGLNLAFMNGYTWAEFLTKLENREIDLLHTCYDTEERRAFARFTRPYVQNLYGLVVKKGSDIRSLKEMAGKRLAALAGTAYLNMIHETYPDIEIVIYDTTAEIIEAISFGEVEAGFESQSLVEFYMKGNVISDLEILRIRDVDILRGFNPYRIAVRRDWPELLSIIEKGMDAVSDREVEAIRRRWTVYADSTRENIRLTREEADFLERSPVIRVSNQMDWPPFDFVADGKPTGFFIDYLKLLEEKIGARFEFVNGKTWYELIEMFKAGEIDLLHSLGKTPERESFSRFSEPVLYTQLVFVVQKDDPDIHDIRELYGKTVAMGRGWATEAYLRTNHPQIQLLPVDNALEMLRAVSEGRADATVGWEHAVRYNLTRYFMTNLKVGGLFRQFGRENTELHIAVRKDLPLLQDIINKAMAAVTIEESSALQKRWFGRDTEGPTIALTPEEAAFIRDNPTVRVSNEPDWPPFDFVENGEPSGFSIDYLRLLEKRSGLRFEFVTGRNWKELVAKFRNREIDILQPVNKTPEREEHGLLSRPFIATETVYVVRENGPDIESITDLYGKVVAVPRGWAVETYLNGEHPRINLLRFNNELETIQAVSRGAADAAISWEITARYNFTKHFITNLRTTGIYRQYGPSGNEMHLSIRKDWPVLLGIINKAMDAVTIEESEALQARWFGARRETAEETVRLTPEEREFIKAHPVIRASNQADWPPFDFTVPGDNQDEPTGFSVDYLNLLARKIGIRFDFVNGRPWNELLGMFRDKEIDLIHALSASEERKDYALFTPPYFYNQSVFVVRGDAPDVRSIRELHGKTVALGKGWNTVAYIRENHPEIDLLLVENEMEMLRAVSTGKADATITFETSARYTITRHFIRNLKITGVFNIPGGDPDDPSKQLNIAVRNDWPLLLGIIQKAMEAVSVEESETLQRKWFGRRPEMENRIALTPDERAFIQKNPVIRASNEDDWPPFDFVENGEPAGFSIDFLKLLAERIGVRFEFVNGKRWDELLQMFYDGKLDLIHSLSPSPERREQGLFTKPYYYNRSVFVVRRESPNIRHIGDLYGKILAMGRGWDTVEVLKKSHPEIHLLLVENELAMLRAVSSGMAYATITYETTARYNFNRHFIRNLKTTGSYGEPDELANQLAIAVRKEWPIFLGILNKAMESVSPEELARLEKRWLKPPEIPVEDRQIPLTPEEEAYLTEKGTVTYCVDPDWMPIERVNDGGRYEGMGADYLDLFADRIGVAMELLPTANWGESVTAAKERRCDVWVVAKKTPSRSEFMDFTTPYVTFPYVIATTADQLFIERIEQVRDRTFAMVRGHATVEIFRSGYPGIRVVEVENLREGLQKVRKREVFGYIGSPATIGYLIQKEGMVDIKITGKLNESFDLGVATRNDEPLLGRIFQKAVDSLSEEEGLAIYNKWLSVRFREGLDYSLLWKLVAATGMIFLGFILWNRSLVNEIRKRRMAEMALRDARRKALAASKAKSEFLANMSHEIRTPMNAIIGLNHLIFKTPLTPQQRDYMTKAQRSARNLLGIINDILDFSKIEAGKLQIERTDFDLNEVMVGLSDLVIQRAREKGLELVFDIDPGIPPLLKGDPLRLSQVLLNLTNNAIKFTDEGEIVVAVAPVADDKAQGDDGVRLKFSVKDTGIGLTQEERRNLFQPFHQGDASTTRRYGGTGLGLAISRQLVGMMGGEIGVESEYGRGSTFFFTVNFGSRSERRVRERVTPEILKGLRVLVVENNATTRQVFHSYLSAFSFDVAEVASGEAALTEIRRAAFANEKPYGLVLVDWRLIDMDGLEVSRRILNEASLPVRPKVVMVTAHGREEVIQQAEDIGLDGFLIKPVTQSILFDTIMQAFGQRPEQREPLDIPDEALPENFARIRGAHILLVEDNAINQQVARELLTTQGFCVSVAENGKEAVAAVRASANGNPAGTRPGPHFDAVLMDIQMPVMDGYASARAIREDRRFAGLPIIAMTADAMTGVRERVLACGMNDFIAKPIDLPDLYKALARWIAPNGREDVAEGGACVGLADVSAPSLPEVEGVDRDLGLLRASGNATLYLNLLKDFYREHLSITRDIREALEKNDQELAQRLVHTTKGVAGNIGAKNLQQAAEALENEIANRDIAGIDTHLLLFDHALKPILESLRLHCANPEPPATPAAAPTETGDVSELAAHLEALEPLIRRGKLKQSRSLINEIMETSWPSRFGEGLSELHDDIADFDFESAEKRVRSLLDTLYRARGQGRGASGSPPDTTATNVKGDTELP